jgi:hypothetical protein
MGADINSNDVVLRMNNAPTLGFEEFVGNFTTVGWCRLTVSKPVLKAPTRMLSALGSRIS